MDKSKRDLIIAIALVGLFAVLFAKNVLFGRRPPPRPAAATVAEQGLTAAAVASAASSLETVRANERNLSAQEAYWEKDWGRDPFVPLGGPAGETAATNLFLSGIVWDDKLPVAMINEKVLRVGDVIDGWRIAEIRPSSVMVASPSGKTVEVQLFQALSESQ